MAPNLLHYGDGTEKMNANTEKRLKLQAAVIHCLIENVNNFGNNSGVSSVSVINVILHCFKNLMRLCPRCVTSVPQREGSSNDGL